MRAAYWQKGKTRKPLQGQTCHAIQKCGYDMRPAASDWCKTSNWHVEGLPRTQGPTPSANLRWAVHLGAYIHEDGKEKQSKKEKGKRKEKKAQRGFVVIEVFVLVEVVGLNVCVFVEC